MPGTYISPAEIELYYLQSRYYDAGIGRFINADAPEVLGTPDNILDSNLFSYCFNNPIMLVDAEGQWPEYYKSVTSSRINCYAYVLGLKTWRNVPGAGMGTDIVRLYLLVYRDITENLKRKAIKLGPSYITNKKYDRNKYYTIAMRVGHARRYKGRLYSYDYHFMVIHANNMVSHKPASTVSQLIGWVRYHNPSKINWNRPLSAKYNSRIKGYIVTEWIPNFYNSITLYIAVERK